MSSDYFAIGKSTGGGGFESSLSPTSTPQAQRSNPLSSKITSVLSTNYTDSDIRDALALLDKQRLENTAETRRRIRLDLQWDVIQSNGEIVGEFAHVAEVGHKQQLLHSHLLTLCSNLKGSVRQLQVSRNVVMR